MPRSVRNTLMSALPVALVPLGLHTRQVRIDTARGPVTLAVAPEKIAVYDIAAIDTLTALGVPVAGVQDLERLAMLAPDLIVVGGRSATQFDAVAPLAPVIDMTILEDPLTQARHALWLDS